MSFVEDTRYFNIMSINKVQCKCGCSQSISPTKKLVYVDGVEEQYGKINKKNLKIN